ncbi:hypothetical protein B0O80DRAFT_425321 [Mortierella sp. GBAus27b]|nr:hypothetical protein B0O80DRAFT_425321 [Mortierella sp. GBAus27b]
MRTKRASNNAQLGAPGPANTSPFVVAMGSRDTGWTIDTEEFDQYIAVSNTQSTLENSIQDDKHSLNLLGRPHASKCSSSCTPTPPVVMVAAICREDSHFARRFAQSGHPFSLGSVPEPKVAGETNSCAAMEEFRDTADSDLPLKETPTT